MTSERPGAKVIALHPRGPLSRETPDHGALEGVRVLVVDDDEDARLLLGSALKRTGAVITLSYDGLHALDLLTEERYDVIVSDIAMPRLDGHGMLVALRAMPEDMGSATPAIALTAFAAVEDRVSALEAGFDEHVAKPVELNELVRRIGSLVLTRQRLEARKRE